jgi:glycerophosphoryl diester phosphodiesterase
MLIKAVLHQVLTAYRNAAYLFWPLITLHLTVRIIVSAILLPLAGFLLSVVLLTTDQTALTDQDIAWFILTPAGLVGGLLLVSLLIVAAILDVAAMITLLHRRQDATLRTVVTALLALIPRLIKLLHFSALFVLRITLIALPFIAIAAVTAVTVLDAHDINYYLTYRPTNFVVATTLITVLGLALGFVVLSRLSAWALALHFVLFDAQPPGSAFHDSANRMRGHQESMIARILAWLLQRVVLLALSSVAFAFAIATARDAFASDLYLVAAMTIALLVGWAGINAVISALSNGALADLLNHQYRNMTGLFAGASQLATPPLSPTAKTATPAVVIAVVAAVVTAGGFYSASALLDRLGAEETVEIIAHRGAAGVRPENTLASIEKAVEDGADWVEIDVQESADGIVVVAHDSDFMKVAGNDLKIWDATIDDLAVIDIGSWFDPAYSAERTPTLREALLVVKNRSRMLIELKYYGHDSKLEERVALVVEETGMADDIAVMSLKYDGVRKFHALRPAWRRGVLAARAIGDVSRLEADFLALNTGQVSTRLIGRAHAAGKSVYAWTVNDPVTMSRMISMGIDGLITDHPALAREVIETRKMLSMPERLALWLSDRFSIGSFSLVADSSDA